MRRVTEMDAIGTKITGGGVGISVRGVDATDHVAKGASLICACFDAHNDDDGSDLIEDTVHRVWERAFTVAHGVKDSGVFPGSCNHNWGVEGESIGVGRRAHDSDNRRSDCLDRTGACIDLNDLDAVKKCHVGLAG
ncbi:hypothetical protein [uncultured Tateyamaria sp.]|uniref:hypothetical protein n=1 Tax=uncultured Tateyamaria sp. TaxID=455651 RepID=UPI002610782B|nr:hypothetical protein [uncultured Tateyamaria sp.]